MAIDSVHFSPKVFLTLYPSFENSRTAIAINVGAPEPMSKFAHIVLELGGQNSDVPIANLLGGPFKLWYKNTSCGKSSAAQFLKCYCVKEAKHPVFDSFLSLYSP